jgi:hypothetical protein
MHKPKKTEQEQLDFFQRSYEKFLQANASIGEINYFYSIGGTSICLKFAGEALIGCLTPALEHHRVREGGSPDLTLCLWDSDSTGTDMIPPPCSRDRFTDRGDIWGFKSSRVKTAFHWSEYSVNLLDLDTNIGIFWVQTAKTLPYWVQSSPLRTLLHWWMEKNGCQLLHGAAVGTEHGAVLFTGKGGVGKSTASLSCLQAGFDFLGDDYVVARMEPSPIVLSLYSTAKLDTSQMVNFPDFSPIINNPENLDSEKAVLFLQPDWGQHIVREMPLKAILIPQFADQEATTISAASSSEIQRAMSFTTLSQLPYAGSHTHDYISRLIAALPHYRLELGKDLTLIPDAIANLLASLTTGQAHQTVAPPVSPTSVERPLVTVIIPVFNGQRFIREAVENVLIQNYPALEIIIVNDGSTDQTEAIIKQIPVDVRYFRQENSGPAAARNRGIRDASGEFIAFLDVDDLWPENNLHSLMEEMIRYPELDIVRGYGQLMEYYVETDNYKFMGSPKDSFFHFIGAGLYRKTVFEKVGLFDPTMRFAEDADWYIRAEELGINMKRLEETTLYVRRHGQNMTEGKNMLELNTLKLFKKFIDRKRIQGGQTV